MGMDTEFVGKCLDMANNVSKLANTVANKKETKQMEKQEEQAMSNPHNQTVEVKVGNPDEAKKPIIVKEKTEQHIHKVFPDNRELTENECEIEKLRLENEHELKMKELEFRIQQEEENRRERREREEYARRERERRQESDKKFFRRMGIGIGVGAVALVGLAAYDIYTDPRRVKGNGIHLRIGKGVTEQPVQADGEVK